MGETLVRIEPADVAQVLGKVENDCNITALARQAGAATTRENGRVELPAGRDRRNHAVDRARDHETDGHLAIVGGISCIERAGGIIEADLPFHYLAQTLLQPLGVAEPLVRMRTSCGFLRKNDERR